MAAQIIQYLLGATEYRRFVDLLVDRKLFHFGMGGPLGEAVGANGSVVNSEGKTDDGADRGDRDDRNDRDDRDDRDDRGGDFGRKEGDDGLRPDFGRKVSEEALLPGSKTTDDSPSKK